MKIATFNGESVGVIGRDDTVVDCTDLLQRYDPIGPEDLLPDLITHYDELRDELERRASAGGGKSLDEVKLNSPLIRPTKIICLIGNYREGTDRPPQTLDIFLKNPEGIVGHGDTVILPPHQASIFHHEAEIAMVIGPKTKDISEADAMNAVFGYVAYNDVSARGLGREGINSFLGKSFDTFAGFGPWIVTKDEIPDPFNLHITVDVDGERRQDYWTNDIERPFQELVSYISSIMTLNPGDVICCGTNHQGLGAMQHGDSVTTSVSGIGAFTLHVEDSTERAWQRGIDEEMAARVRAQGQQAPAQGNGGASA